MNRAGPMLGHALRRLLWTIPALFAISVVTFLFLSFVPDPTEDPRLVASLSPRELEEARRARFLDLPRFFNAAPEDVRSRAARALQRTAAGGAEAAVGAEALARLGGAALPHVLPELDALAPEPRLRVALALAPVARRMALPDAEEAADPRRTVAFWARYWDERGALLRPAEVHTAVARLARYRTASRLADVTELDTFALEEILRALAPPESADDVAAARVLVEVLARATGRDERIGDEATVREARATVQRWRRYWRVHRTDFVALSGTARVTAVISETRYGKWAEALLTERLGRTAGGRTVLGELVSRAPLTLAVVWGAIFLAYGLAIPVGAVAALYRNRRIDLALALVVLVAYVVPTAVLSVLVTGLVAPDGSLLAPTLVLAVALVAAPTRAQRSALLDVLGQDYVRTALAKGAGRYRVVFRHGLRNALAPVVTLAALEPPMALGGAFVVEQVFGLHGLGEVTMVAVEARDIAWLMALSLFAAASAALFVVLTDVAYALLDPRLARLAVGAPRR